MSILHGGSASVDEAGVRYDGARYFAFETMVDARLESAFLGGSKLVIEDSTSGVHELRISNEAPLDLFAAIVRRLEAYREPHSVPALPERLRRGDAVLDAWLASLLAASEAGATYRTVGWDQAMLMATIAEDRAAPDARAAAAYVLLATGDDDTVAHVVRCLAGGAPSPLVLAAVRLSPVGDALVPDYAMNDAAPYLAQPDRVLLQRALTVRSDDAVHARMGGIRERVSRELAAEMEADHAPRARAALGGRGLRFGSSTDLLIGRTFSSG